LDLRHAARGLRQRRVGPDDVLVTSSAIAAVSQAFQAAVKRPVKSLMSAGTLPAEVLTAMVQP